jgi:hypothetical protein
MPQITPNDTEISTNEIIMEKIKEEYIYGTITDEGQIIFQSQPKLSEIYNINIDAIKYASKKEKWSALRKEHRSDTALKIKDGKSEHTAKKILQSDDKFAETLELGRLVGHIQLEKNLAYLQSDPKHILSGTQYKHTIDGIRGCQDGIKITQGEVINKVELVGLNVHEKIKERAEQYEQLNTETDGND